MDWNKLKPYKNSKNKSLEQLCFQIARKLYANEGVFTEIDDSGGGDGVEFYLTKHDGTIIGWQAKFYEGSQRLKDGGRKKAILGSFKKACKVHPDLHTWYLCTNTKFTPQEQTWFESKVKQSVANSNNIIIEHWSEGKINAWLDEPQFAGLKSTYFGELELSPNWFQGNFDQFYHLIDNKFSKSLHTKDSQLFQYYIDPLLLNNTHSDYFSDKIQSIVTDNETIRNNVKLINFEKHPEFRFELSNLFEQSLAFLLEHIQRINQLKVLKQNKNIKELLELASQNNVDDLFGILQKFNDYWEYLHKSTDNAPQEYSLTQHKTKIKEAIDEFGGIANSLEYLYGVFLRKSYHSFNLLGDAGIGKTHICTSIALDYLSAELPVIFIPAKKITDNSSIQNQILQLLDIKSEYSFEIFLKTLNSLGEINGVRVPILIDGINESTDNNGKFLNRWKIDLPSIEQNLASFDYLVLITTCRSSYVNQIWPGITTILDSRFHTYKGMRDDIDIEKMVRLYFQQYGIETDFHFFKPSYFKSPIFLKIFCEANTSKQNNEIVFLEINDDTFYEVVDKYIAHIDTNIKRRYIEELGYPNSGGINNVATVNCSELGRYLWENNLRSIPLEEAFKIIDKNQQIENYFFSKSRFLIEEGLLFSRDGINDSEIVSFTYDLIAGYCIAKYLIERYKTDYKTLINSRYFNVKLFGKNNFHPLYEDISECFTTILPKQTTEAYHLYEYYDQEFKKPFSYSILRFFKISGNCIKERHVTLSKELFNIDGNQLTFLKHAEDNFFNARHPLNFLFFSNELKKLPLIKKDLLWLEFIRNNNSEYANSLLKRFENDAQKIESASLIERQQFLILIHFAIWMLASNFQKTRDLATKALYYYGRKNPDTFLKIFNEFINVNDPYIIERFCAISFGIIEALENNLPNQNFLETTLSNYAIFLYKNFFFDKAPYATTHILTREYCYKIIVKALRYDDTIKLDQKYIKKPFHKGGIRKWKVEIDKNEKDYRDGNSLIDYHFLRNELYGIAPGDIYNKNEEREKILGHLRWRAYSLGYDFELFKNLDSTLERWKDYKEDGKIQSYGEKYIWIAFFELAGYLQDNKKLQPYRGEMPYPFYDKTIDPTFPGKLPDIFYFTDDLIGNRQSTWDDWLTTKIPSITHLIRPKSLLDIDGEWVLLESTICQTDEDSNKQITAWKNAIFIHEAKYQNTIKIFSKNKILDRNIRQYFDAEIFSSEIPFSPLIPNSNTTSVEYLKSTKDTTVEHYEWQIVIGDKELNPREIENIWKSIGGKA
ncbi:hypothetical protein CJD36_020740 [Flavipsychrobacter stenotrophus]|uniref:Uncharacterized protein n=1 Tax=Flavipsychrobacter stenotrophus TaxID=2077091 RepID=A0A2S7SRN8_9BACT|nr:ATP-binding protein [Flavipsychrobacter stenotrophus]PQJ09216.1 hypothetical protein CJD36_020740 [Flavipsychrobacter stenotrophus]